jgi:D-alanine--poly(phosphoribitol) ligase subunit 1
MPPPPVGIPPPAPRSLDEFFSASVRKYPDRPALWIAGRNWSYAELDATSRRIEQSLKTAGLTGKRCNVGLVYAGSAFSYAAVIAIMRSRHVYVPLNPKLPAERLETVIADAHLRAVVIDASDGPPDSVICALRKFRSLTRIASDAPLTDAPAVASPEWRSTEPLREPAEPLDQMTDTPADRRGPPMRLAYVMYTSGSTGTPKGVAISHESACSCIETLQRITESCEEDRFTQFSALSFDVSISDLFLCWKSGGTLYVPAPSEALVPLNFAIRHGITVWSSVPSLANILLRLRLLRKNVLPRLRVSMFAGEGLPCELAQAWAEAAPQARLLNFYGPTEVTIVATYYPYEKENTPRAGIVPIGTPFPGMRCMIVADDRVVDVDDVPGELWMSGSQLACGYWNNMAATRKSFVRFPLDAPLGEIWSRTGDIVSHRRGVGFSFHGRADRQVKLHGHRVELQEVESTLRDVTGCALVAVVPVSNTSGISEKLIAYCDRLGADETTVKTRVMSRIPRHMVPERILELAEFPLSPHGKVDYLALAQTAASA